MSFNSVLNVKALVGGFNQEKPLVRAFSVIVKTGYETDGSFYSTSADWRRAGARSWRLAVTLFGIIRGLAILTLTLRGFMSSHK